MLRALGQSVSPRAPRRASQVSHAVSGQRFRCCAIFVTCRQCPTRYISAVVVHFASSEEQAPASRASSEQKLQLGLHTGQFPSPIGAYRARQQHSRIAIVNSHGCCITAPGAVGVVPPDAARPDAAHPSAPRPALRARARARPHPQRQRQLLAMGAPHRKRHCWGQRVREGGEGNGQRAGARPARGKASDKERQGRAPAPHRHLRARTRPVPRLVQALEGLSRHALLVRARHTEAETELAGTEKEARRSGK